MLIRTYNNTETVVYGGMLQNSVHTIDSGQTATYADPYSIRFSFSNLTQPITVDFCVYIFTRGMLANGDSLIIASFDDPDLTNNRCCKQVTILPVPTGIGDMQLNPTGFRLYPNPAGKMVFVKPDRAAFDDALVYIKDLSGRVLIRSSYNRQELRSGKEIAVDISGLAVGMYVLTLEQAGKSVSQKLLIRK